eukprot:338427-Prorocentrum_minimum.AAC.3
MADQWAQSECTTSRGFGSAFLRMHPLQCFPLPFFALSAAMSSPPPFEKPAPSPDTLRSPPGGGAHLHPASVSWYPHAAHTCVANQH